MTLGHPSQLYWLLVLLPMLVGIVWFEMWRRRRRREIGDPALIDRMTIDHSQTLRWGRIGLLTVGVALLAVSLAEPRWGRTETTVERQGVDVVFALDLSKSMLARDVPPNRLEAATDEIKETLTKLSGDRIGLVVFTAVSFVQSPLTTDYGALRFYLDQLDPQQMSVGGTAIGRAMRDATELLIGRPLDEDETSPETSEMDRADTQVIVLITDGEDHKTDPLSAAKTARKHGIHVVTVGVGGEKGAKIPVVNDSGEVEGYKRDRRGDLIRTKLDAEQLRTIADETKGRYVEYQGQRSAVDRLVGYIDQLQKTTFEDELQQTYEDRFMFFLVPGFLCLLLGIVIGERRSGVLGWSFRSNGTRDEGSGWLGLLVLLIAFLPGCQDVLRSAHPEVERGNQFVAKEQYDKALDTYNALDQDESVSDSPLLEYNRGVAELGKSNHEAARHHFGRALEADDAGRQFDAHYNLGVTLARQEEWKKALSSFESALQVAVERPEATSDEWLERTRHNLELAYRKLYPPCRELEDDREDNDGPEAAPPLRGSKQKQGRRGQRSRGPAGARGGQKGSKKSQDDPTKELTLCGLDDDWYTLDVMPGSTVTVEATFRQLRDEPLPNHEFLPRPEDLEISLLGADGDTRLARDQTGPELEEDEPPTEKTEPPVTRTIEPFEVTRDMPIGSSGTLNLRVSAADNLEYEYDLDVQVEPPCRALQEDSEDNDAKERAELLEESGQNKLQLCPGDEDWFRVEAEMGDSIFVDVRPRTRNKKRKSGDGNKQSKPKPSDLTLEMIDAETEEVVTETKREGPFLTAEMPDIEKERDFYLRVKGADDDHAGPYTLDLYAYAPCIVGDDKYEENDQLSSAASFKKRSKIHRYLRLCPDDPDFYKVRSAIPKSDQSSGGNTAAPPARNQPSSGSNASGSTDKKARVGVGLSLVDPPEPPSEAETSIDLMMPDVSGSVLAEGKVPESDSNGSTDDDASSSKSAGDERRPSNLPLHRVARARVKASSGTSTGNRPGGRPGQRGGGGASTGPKVPVRVQGEPTFYHMVELTPQSGQNNQNQQKQKKNNQQNQQQKQANNQNKQHKKSKSQQRKSSSEKSKKQQRAQKRKPNKKKQKRTEDILKSLEQSDRNFQMKKALKNKGKRRIQKDW